MNNVIINSQNKSTDIVIKDAEVAFAALAGEGMKSKFNTNRQYNLCVEVTAEQKDEIMAEIEKVWKENKSPKTKKPQYDNDRIFGESKNKDGGFTIWVSEDVTNKIVRKVKKGSGYGMKQFLDMGAGSKVDAEFKFFFYNRDGLEALGFRLVGATLNNFVPYTGGSNLDGEELVEEDIVVSNDDDDDNEGLLDDFHEALSEKDFDEADEILDELTDHADFKKLRQELRTARKAA